MEPQEQQEDSRWSPSVKLAGAGTSTLSSKIELIPKYVHAPNKFKKHLSLEKLDLKSQEAVIMEDILYVMMGCEGYYIRYSDAYDPTIQFDKLKGPDFRISKSLDPSLKDLTRTIVESAKHFLALRAFVESQSRPEYGLVNQALCASLRKFLNQYALLTAQLERQVFYNEAFTLHNMAIRLNHISTVLRHGFDLAQGILKENDKKSEESANVFNDFDKVLESLKESNGSSNLNQIGITVSSTKSTVCKGGTILRILAGRLNMYSGDPTARDLLKTLLTDASKPYLRMLTLWIHKGVIDDPYEEFLVREFKSIPRERLDLDYTDEYWEKRYTIRKDDLPLQLSSSEVYEKVLLAGKYLNVVRECSGTDVSKDVDETFESIEDSRIVLSLSSAYSHANQSLLSLLIKTHNLPSRLTSLKHYFLLDRADFLINFMDIAEKELSKPSRKASVTKLQYLLDMSLRQPGSISSTDPFKDEVIVDMTHTSVTDYLLKIVNVSGMDPSEAMGFTGKDPNVVEKMFLAANRAESVQSASSDEKDKDRKTKYFIATMGLQLDFRIPFPLSLVLSRKTILRYQLLFRHLVELKHIERNLNNSWVEQAKSKVWRATSSNERLNEWRIKAVKLRVKMLLFVQQVLYFCTMEVIEPNWSKLESNLLDAKTVDSLMEQHVYYLDTCMKECMLTNQKLLKLQAKLFMACRMFGEFLLQRTKTLIQISPEVLSPEERGNLKKVLGKNGEELGPDDLMNWLENTLNQYEASFDHHLKVLMEALNYYAATETTVLLSLCARLEMNLTVPAIFFFQKKKQKHRSAS